MKRMLLVAALSLAVVGLSAAPASAGFFSPCCSKYCTLHIKPYNAFSPVAFGTICCDGFSPLGTSYPGGGFHPGLEAHGVPSWNGHGTVIAAQPGAPYSAPGMLPAALPVNVPSEPVPPGATVPHTSYRHSNGYTGYPPPYAPVYAVPYGPMTPMTTQQMNQPPVRYYWPQQ